MSISSITAMGTTGAITSDTIADIIRCDYQGNISHNRNTSDEIFGINQVPSDSFNDFVNKYLVNNKFDYKDIKIEYDDELQLVSYTFPSFMHLIATPLMLILFHKEPIDGRDISADAVESNRNSYLSDEEKSGPVEDGTGSGKEKPETKQEEPQILKKLPQGRPLVANTRNNNYIVAYYQVNNFLPILLKSKNKIASLNKNLLIIPDGVVLNPQALSEPIFAVEVANVHNLDKMRYKILHSYTRFKRPNSYKTILLLILDDHFDVSVEVWKKVPLPKDYNNYQLEELVEDYVNIPSSLNKQEEYKKIQAAIQESRYSSKDRHKHRFLYYMQHKVYHISYGSCTFNARHDEKMGIPLHYFDIHFPETTKSDKEHEKLSNSIIILHYDEVRLLVGALIQQKVEILKNDLGCLSIVENIRNRAKKNFFDLCELLDFPNA